VRDERELSDAMANHDACSAAMMTEERRAVAAEMELAGYKAAMQRYHDKWLAALAEVKRLQPVIDAAPAVAPEPDLGARLVALGARVVPAGFTPPERWYAYLGDRPYPYGYGNTPDAAVAALESALGDDTCPACDGDGWIRTGEDTREQCHYTLGEVPG